MKRLRPGQVQDDGGEEVGGDRRPQAGQVDGEEEVRGPDCVMEEMRGLPDGSGGSTGRSWRAGGDTSMFGNSGNALQSAIYCVMHAQWRTAGGICVGTTADRARHLGASRRYLYSRKVLRQPSEGKNVETACTDPTTYGARATNMKKSRHTLAMANTGHPGTTCCSYQRSSRSGKRL